VTRTLARHRIVALVWSAAAGLSLSACHAGWADGTPGKTGGAAPPESPYATIANGKVDIEGGVVEVAARRAGVIKEVLVQEGDTVRKGQILARQEDDDATLAVNSAEAAVAQARSTLSLTQISVQTAQREHERLTKLTRSGLVTQQQLDQAADSLATAQAQLSVQRAAVQTAQAQLAQTVYNRDLTIIRAPMDGKIIRRYANPGAGASTLNVSVMFDLAPAAPHIIRAEIVESAIPDVRIGQEAEIVPEADPSRLAVGRVIRIAATFGARKLKSDAANEASDERVVEVVVSADSAPFLIGQRVLVKFMRPGEKAGRGHAGGNQRASTP
jgi:RND family efflux transporter MFP subunit